ncbi:Type III restriction-modification system methylation subunit (EC 2.1.1.72) [uncultured Gammaproteobacteria bacterium]|nr:Type III restriction-modification system methylation subunit (EC 2.1.1.72) [uncultured Gammaproteobacteria bacterium]
MKFNQQLEQLLKTLSQFTDAEGELLKQNVKHSAEKFDPELIKLLLNDPDSKAHFFDEIDTATIFNYRKFIDYIDDKNFLIDSYTKFSNKVGLTVSNKHIQQINEVVLSFPFKDCVLEGGQSKDDEKRKEIFFNEVLAKDEINRLLNKKVITSAKKYTQNGVSDKVNFNRNENGLIKDNLIIKGNNLLALHTLKSNFAGKVKLIYIDPPYNTGNDSFNYNDNFNHSTWLTFMKNRLEVARDLLSEDGVIFVQCDDNEQAYLKVLMDEIFGRGNFLNDIIWNSTKSVTNTAIISVSHTHSLVFFKYKDYYVKNRTEFRLEEDGKGFSNPDNDERGKWKADPFQVGGWRPNQQYEIKNPNTKKIYTPNEGCSWKNDYKKFQILLNDNKIVFGKDGKSAPQRKRFLSEALKKGRVSKTIWDDLGTTTNGTQHLKSIFGKSIFNNPKPEELLQRIIQIATKKGDLVLDYHLGSGTTCAVAHKMGRQYIGIEQMDYIEDIAVKRMQKVIGKTVKKDDELLESLDFDAGGISKSVDWQGGGEFIYFELDKYNQKYIDKLNAIKRGHGTAKTIEQLYDEITKHAFLNYDVESEKLLASKKDFEKLSLTNQLEFLFSILNKNQLYKNLAEIDDKDLTVDEKTKHLNNDFYHE